MGDQQAHALEARKSRRDGLAGGDIDVIGGLVHNKQIGTLPERAGNLQALLLAAGQGFVTPDRSEPTPSLQFPHSDKKARARRQDFRVVRHAPAKHRQDSSCRKITSS